MTTATLPIAARSGRAASLGVERALTIAAVSSNVLIVFGGQWDAGWHLRYGRDTFWSPLHLLIYGGMLASLLVGLGAWLTTVRRGAGWRTLGALRAQPVLLLPAAATLLFLATGALDDR